MSTVSISLSANTSQYVQRLRQARTETDRNIIRMERRIDEFARNVNNNFTSVDGSINAMLGSLGNMKHGGYVAAVGAIGLAAYTVSSQMTELARTSLESEKILRIAAEQSRSTADELQHLGMVTGFVGIDIQKMGDMSKDVFDKMGDYITTGQGAFVDFYDVVGKGSSTTIQSLQKLSGIEVLGAVVAEMEKAGASGSQMTFVLESLASESSNLLPLLRGNSEELKRLQERMQSIATTPMMLKSAAEEIVVMDSAFNSMWNTFGVMMGQKMDWFHKAMGDMYTTANNWGTDEVKNDQRKEMIGTVTGGGYDINRNESIDRLTADRNALQAAHDTINIADVKVNTTELDRQIAEIEKTKDRLTTQVNYESQIIKDKAIEALEAKKLVLHKAELDRIKVEAKAQVDSLNYILKSKDDNKGANTKNGDEAIKNLSNIAGVDPKQIQKELNAGKEAQAAINNQLIAQEQELKSLQGIDVSNMDEEAQAQHAENLKLKDAEIKASEELMKAQIDREQSLHDKRTEIANKAAKARTDAEEKEAAKQNKIIDNLLSSRLENIQHEIQSAVTKSERVDAIHALEIEKRGQELNAGKISQDQYDDYMLNARYTRYQAEAELNDEYSTNEFVKKMELAEAERTFWQNEYDADNISHNQYLENKAAADANYTSANRELVLSQLDAMSGVMSGLSSLAKDGSNERKILFAAEKTAAIASLSITQWEAWGKANGWGEKAAVIASYAGALGSVASVTLGQFHSGEDEVDQTGSYLLKSGERVVQESANKDLTNYLNNNRSGASGTVQVEAPLIIEGDTSISEQKLLQMMVQQREQIARMVDMARRESPSMR